MEQLHFLDVPTQWGKLINQGPGGTENKVTCRTESQMAADNEF